MIDYEKLKLLTELLNNLQYIDWSVSYSNNERKNYYAFSFWENDLFEEFSFDNIDELITTLQELTQPEPKYKEAWYLIGNFPKSTLVHNRECYQFCDMTAPEALGRVMYDSRQILIQAQIDYWRAQLQEPCQHESNDERPHYCPGLHDLILAGIEPPKEYFIKHYKCKKCGEYYK